MYVQSVSHKWGGGNGNLLSRKRWWIKTITSVVTLLCMVMLISACGSNNAATTGSTPTTTGDIPTSTPDAATPTSTPAAATATATAAQAPQATTAPVANGPVPTKPPVVSSQAPTPTPKPTVPTPTPTTAPSSGNTVQVWVQVTDSCRQALPGGTFSVSGPGISTTIGPTSGSVHVTVPGAAGCPIPHGTCSINVGCASVNLNKPSSGTATYTITIAHTATGWGTNASFAVCEGGSDCPHGPEKATVQVSSSGSVSATTLNIYPNGVPITYGPFTGANGDPIMFHEFGIAANTAIQCDGDSDADDYLTGTKGGFCDSDGPGR